ncbi:secretory 1A [Perilla frutescens var. frutescens]|nr:secretory 1A [Perilla frutescens var. frutescens]
MSFSDSECSHGGEYKTLRLVSRDRLLYEMLQDTKAGGSRSSWKVLIMDKVTVKVMSHSCKMADITDQDVSFSPDFVYCVVEDLFKRREPMPSMDVIYFIQPSRENLIMFLSDMSGREPLYRKAYVYFSTPVPKDLVAHIKSDSSVIPRIGALREMNLEYFPIESQAFTTDQESALEELFGDSAENTRKADACLNLMASRIATVFASLKEFPFVRYKASKGGDGDSAKCGRELIPTKLATAVWNNITTYKSSIPQFPSTETCELLIVDRSVDQIAPIIHEWTYDAMCHDLLDLEGNKYVHEIPSKSGGEPEKKEVLLEDSDPLWLELRDAHIAEASEKLHEKMTNFVSKNKAAQLQQRDGSELSTRDIQKMVQALPQYNEQMEKLSIHVAIAGKLNSLISELDLRDLGQLEQDLVFGDAGTKEIINFLRSNQDGATENKLRLLMIYRCVSPEKFEGDKAVKLMQLAKLTRADMQTVTNMKLLEVSDSRKTSQGTFSLKFDSAKKKNAERKDRAGDEEEGWALSRFYPKLEELIEQLGKGDLPKDEYQCMNSTSSSNNVSSGGSKAPPVKPGGQSNAPHSMRSRRTAAWAKSRASDDGYSSDSVLGNLPADPKRMGQRIFVFIIGGATRSELRVCHKLTAKLRREVVLGTTSLDDPPQYITRFFPDSQEIATTQTRHQPKLPDIGRFENRIAHDLSTVATHEQNLQKLLHLSKSLDLESILHNFQRQFNLEIARMDAILPIISLSVIAGAVIAFVIFGAYSRKRKSEIQSIARPENLNPKPASKPSAAKKPQHKSHPHSHAADKDANKKHHHLDLNTLKGHGDAVTGLCFSPDGRSLATACGDGVVRVFKLDDVSSKSFKFLRINLPAGGHPSAVSFNGDAASIVVASQALSGSSLYMYGEEKGKTTGDQKQQNKLPLPEIKWERHKVHDKRAIITLFGTKATYGSADGSPIILSCSEGTDIILWHGKTGNILGNVDTNQLKNTMATVSPNGRFIAAAAFTADVKVWEIVYSKDGSVKEISRVMQLKGHKSAVTWLCFSRNSEQIITASKDGSIRIWNINVRYHLDEDSKTLKVFPIPLHDENGTTLHYDHLSLSPDGKILAATHGSTLQWLCAETGQVLDMAEKAHDGDITDMSWAPTTILMENKQTVILATASNDKKVKLWAAPPLNPS